MRLGRILALLVTTLGVAASSFSQAKLSVHWEELTAGDFREGHNLANLIDSHYLPLRKWDGDHDPEGLLSTLPAIANCLLGT